MKNKLKAFFTGKAFLYCLILILLAGNIVSPVIILYGRSRLIPARLLDMTDKNVPIYGTTLFFEDGGRLEFYYTDASKTEKPAILLGFYRNGDFIMYEADASGTVMGSCFRGSRWHLHDYRNASRVHLIDNTDYFDTNRDGIYDRKTDKNGCYVRMGVRFHLCSSINHEKMTAVTADGRKVVWKENDWVEQ